MIVKRKALELYQTYKWISKLHSLLVEYEYINSKSKSHISFLRPLREFTIIYTFYNILIKLRNLLCALYMLGKIENDCNTIQ